VANPDRPRLLLVPGFSELEWAIKPRLEEWAEVASYDPPGVGDEPLPEGGPKSFTRELIVQRGLAELDRRGWDRFFVAADGEGVSAGAVVADARKAQVQGLALGHAKLSLRREGDRAPLNGEIWAAMTQLLQQDYESFIRYGIAQVTRGSVDEERAQRMVDRMPPELLALGWEIITRDDVPIGTLLEGLDCPLLLAKHEGCLLSTEEGFEDAVAAFPDARTVSVRDAPSSSEEFADAARSFCLEVEGV
jgi:hypothetical protein